MRRLKGSTCLAVLGKNYKKITLRKSNCTIQSFLTGMHNRNSTAGCFYGILFCWAACARAKVLGLIYLAKLRFFRVRGLYWPGLASAGINGILL